MARTRMADFSEFPDAFPASSENAKREYRRSDTHFAVHGRKSSPGATIELNSEKIAVYPISRLSDFSEAVQSTPVYALQPGSRIAVPTGRVFVRLAPKQRFEDHADNFRKAGYEIIESVSYAPNAGWLRSAKSSIAAALAGLRQLASLPAVENVEPQMLTEAIHRK
jgi:hypothetical protein